ncbi:hypothetical protein [Nocardia miyunensis]|uniref:hypothetical protein n=1 Tax=Nocardia miyunensis TaxID=282684 RepID=UPI000A51A1B4|nr:hypothetical protein [Nocardia miyunensis]
MIEIGDLVKTSADSDQVFAVTEIEDEVALIAPQAETAPGSYPYWWPIRFLLPAQ